MTQTYGAIKKSKRKFGSHLKRTMIVQTRMSPKLKFIADLIARHQHRTLSSLIESLLVEVTERYHLPAVVTEKAQTDHYLFGERQTKKVAAQEIGERIWSAEESDRFAAMALFVPSLLTSEEDALWQAIMETPYFWNHFEIHIENPAGTVVETEWWPLVDYRGFNCERLREYWPLCQAILDDAEPIEKFKALDLPSGKRVEKPDYYPYPIKKVRTDL